MGADYEAYFGCDERGSYIEDELEKCKEEEFVEQNKKDKVEHKKYSMPSYYSEFFDHKKSKRLVDKYASYFSDPHLIDEEGYIRQEYENLKAVDEYIDEAKLHARKSMNKIFSNLDAQFFEEAEEMVDVLNDALNDSSLYWETSASYMYNDSHIIPENVYMNRYNLVLRAFRTLLKYPSEAWGEFADGFKRRKLEYAFPHKEYNNDALSSGATAIGAIVTWNLIYSKLLEWTDDFFDESIKKSLDKEFDMDKLMDLEYTKPILNQIYTEDMQLEYLSARLGMILLEDFLDENGKFHYKKDTFGSYAVEIIKAKQHEINTILNLFIERMKVLHIPCEVPENISEESQERIAGWDEGDIDDFDEL